jgi:hypothetical protein
MRYLLDSSPYSFQVTRAAEARKDFGKDVQKVDRETGRPQWVVELLAQDSERGETSDAFKCQAAMSHVAGPGVGKAVFSS